MTPDTYTLPGLATAHSHAFQRALRGRTQRKSTQAHTFWSWRKLMYDLVEKLTPETMYAIARFAYAELSMSGVTAVGEFHYVHHQPDGQPYDNRAELAQAVIQAALDVDLRICLIRTAYLRGGYQQPLSPSQRRFADPDVETVLRDIDDLRHQFAGSEQVRVAVAAHSVRAVPLNDLRQLAAYAEQYELPFHMHLCEQKAELEACQAEYGVTPITLLAQNDLLSSRLVAVHATHLSRTEISQAQAMICLCRTTERDLGDGLPPTSDLVAAGARLCVGVDSHASENAFEEVRAVELDERSRLEKRHTVGEADFLLNMATSEGYHACNLTDTLNQDTITLNLCDPAIAGVSEALRPDAVIFAATPRTVSAVQVGPNLIVENGLHRQYDKILVDYLSAIKTLF